MLRMNEPGIERFSNFRLQAYLLVKTYFKICQQTQFITLLRISFKKSIVITCKGLAEVILAIWRRTRNKFFTESDNSRLIVNLIVQAGSYKACKLTSDFFKHFFITAGHRIARPAGC